MTKTNQEARDDERGALIDAMINVEVSNGMVEFCADDRDDAGYLADALIAAGYRNHPEPEITDEMIRRGALAMCRMDWKISMGGATTLAKAALEAALRVPIGEGEQE